MSTYPNPTKADHATFCRIEGWTLVRDAKGRPITHHVTYNLTLPDGRVLRTHISRPIDRTDYGPALWARVLRHELHVSAEEFWTCVKNNTKPDRGIRAAPRESLPVALVQQLIRTVGLTEAEVADMTKTQAIDRLNRYWTEGK